VHLVGTAEETENGAGEEGDEEKAPGIDGVMLHEVVAVQKEKAHEEAQDGDNEQKREGPPGDGPAVRV
jgi:hypothetical protein